MLAAHKLLFFWPCMYQPSCTVHYFIGTKPDLNKGNVWMESRRMDGYGEDLSSRDLDWMAATQDKPLLNCLTMFKLQLSQRKPSHPPHQVNFLGELSQFPAVGPDGGRSRLFWYGGPGRGKALTHYLSGWFIRCQVARRIWPSLSEQQFLHDSLMPTRKPPF